MRNQENNIIFGLINQPQTWIKHNGRDLPVILNYILLGVINQPQVWIEQTGENMTTEITPTEAKSEKVNVRVQGGSVDAVYGLGIIGACIFYISRATTPQEKALGFLKGLVWPVFLVKEALEFLHKD